MDMVNRAARAARVSSLMDMMFLFGVFGFSFLVFKSLNAFGES
jgi:hypothetical protein